LRFDQLADRYHPLLDISVERGADRRILNLTFGELHSRTRRVDIGAEVLRLLKGGIIRGGFETQRRFRVIARLLRDELSFVQLGGALEALFGL
jgi:hypothetical protein